MENVWSRVPFELWVRVITDAYNLASAIAAAPSLAEALGYSTQVALLHADKAAEPWARYAGRRSGLLSWRSPDGQALLDRGRNVVGVVHVDAVERTSRAAGSRRSASENRWPAVMGVPRLDL